ncbi:YeaA [Bacillus freudenreichii]|nr:YeaA [Bacillus freudenreichii]
MEMKQYIANYIEVYEELRKMMKWKVTDNKILMTIASFYALNQQLFQMERYLMVAEEIKKQAGIFSSIRSESRYITAAMLDGSFEDPEQKIPALFHAYNELIEAKFRRGIFTYIAASVLIKNSGSEPGDFGPVITKAKDIYDRMRKEHFFLTSAEDYPLAMLLASSGRDDVIERNERFYENLNRHGFRKGNHLQMLSHILTLDKEVNAETLLSRTIEVFDAFKEVGLKQKTVYYPVMGMLAMIPPEDLDMHKVHQVYEQLNQTKHFKWQKDLNATLAASFFVKEKLENSTFIETSLHTTLETILQAQQAAMTASITAAAASSSSSGSGN